MRRKKPLRCNNLAGEKQSVDEKYTILGTSDSQTNHLVIVQLCPARTPEYFKCPKCYCDGKYYVYYISAWHVQYVKGYITTCFSLFKKKQQFI